MERDDIGEVLDILADNFGEGWTYHKEDSVHLYLKNIHGKKPPHISIRKDNGLMTCLCGEFQIGEVSIGHQISSQDFIKIVRNFKDTGDEAKFNRNSNSKS